VSGICGIVLRDPTRTLAPACLSPMMSALDVSGQRRGTTVGLGRASLGAQIFARRLAGVAEMTVSGHRFALSLHGSLYNRPDLSAAGKNANPLMELLRAYTAEGVAILQRMHGEFALAIWDGSEETLHLATDRFRIHPIFFYQDADKFVFASRIRGISTCPLGVRLSVNPEAIIDVVASSVIPTPKTIYREVSKLPPGHRLSYRKGDVEITPYWDINFLQPDESSQTRLAHELDERLTDAVAVRLDGDVASDRVGTFLSGGVDSSTITGIMTRLTGQPVKTFSIGFGEERFNEINYARIAAQAFGARHHEYFVSAEDTAKAIDLLPEWFDEPFANASAIPTYFCAQLARAHGVDVLYAGDGGDELFAGNERYASQRLFEYYYRIPAPLREPVLKPLIHGLAQHIAWGPLVKADKYIRRASIPAPERYSSYGFLKVVPPADFFDPDLLAHTGGDYDPYAPISRYYTQAPARNDLDRQLYIDLKLAISDNDLFKVTRTTEASGITARFPFLDQRLAEFAATIPAQIKMRGRRLRTFFKKAYRDLLPPVIRAKAKHGFGLPISGWLRTDKRLNEMMHDLVLSPRSTQRGYFSKKALEQLIQDHRTDNTSFYGAILWNLMILELWHRRHRDSTETKILASARGAHN